MGARGPLRLVQPDDSSGRESAAQRVRPEPPEKPAGLPLEVDELWDEIVPTLNDAGLLSRADGMTVELALRHFVVARRASNNLIEKGAVVEDKHNGGDLKKSPEAQIWRDNSAAFLEFAKQLGLSFASRARVTMPKEADDGENPFSFQAVGR
jgi:P27 family predicted phage terminase small subunit